MKCPSCGHENRKNTRFCLGCGASLTGSDSVHPVSVSVVPDVLQIGQARDVELHITNESQDVFRDIRFSLKDLKVVVEPAEITHAELLPGETWPQKLAIEVVSEFRQLMLPFQLRWKNAIGRVKFHQGKLAFAVEPRQPPPPPSPPTPVPPGGVKKISTAVIRKLLTVAVNDEDLTILCYDHFRPVYEQFSAGMTKSQKIQLLIESCERNGSFGQLLALVREHNPAQFAQFEA